MKIISLGPAHPLRGGIAGFNESMSRELLRQGQEIIIYSYKLQYPSIFFPGKTQYTDAEKPEKPEIIDMVNSISLPNWLKTIENIRRAEPDLLIIHYWMPFFIPALAFIAHKIRASKKIKVILLAHNLIPHEPQPGTKLLTKYLIKSIDGLVALSSKVRQDALSFRQNLPSVILPHPVYDVYGDKVNKEDALQKLGLSDRSKYILFFGIVRKYKGLDLLLQSLKYIEDESVKLIIAGEFYGKKQDYLNLISSEGIGKKVIIRDEYIPNEEIKNYFSASEMLVLPYRSATQSGVAQIALHFEKPALVTRVGGLPEIIEHGETGYIADPDPENIAFMINQYFNNPYKDKMLEEIKKKKEEFSWKHFVKRLTEFSGEI